MNLTRDLSFLIVYLAGVAGLVFWRKKQKDPALFFYGSSWTFGVMMIYFIYLEITRHTFYIGLPLFFFAVFAYSYFTEKRKLLNGLLFNIFLISFGAYLILLLFQTQNILIGGLVALIGVFFILIVIFGIYALIVFLYWNSIVVLKRESHSLANLLTLFLAIFLTIIVFVNLFLLAYLPDWAKILMSMVPTILFYFFIVFYNFLTVSVLYQFNRPRFNQDFIIVLGAGLINGEKVTPLLAKRIDKAIAFYRAQEKATLSPPKLLMSGGQGPDEKVPEAVAMQEYALKKGIPAEQILVETNSKTTLENMLFSKEVMDHEKLHYRAIFTSNNYHIFRAGMYARTAQLKANGIGAKTAFYYLPNAFLREYVAILVMHKKRHLIICGLIASFFILFSLISFFFM